MVPHWIQQTLEKDGMLMLKDLPFHAGETVEVIILPKPPPSDRDACSLRGTPVTYLGPFEPIGGPDPS